MKSVFYLIFIFAIISSINLNGQGLNHYFLLGYNDTNGVWTSSGKAEMMISQSSLAVNAQNRKMKFMHSQANISDSTGNLLFYTNGGWIANNAGDTLLNGSGINPNNWAANNSEFGFYYPAMQLILPLPDSSDKYVLFHQTLSDLTAVNCNELYYSIIDMSLDGGKGGIISNKKNVIAINDTLICGISACKHANGRDWWVSVLKDSSDIIFTLLLTPHGVSNLSSQHLNVPNQTNFISAPMFSPDGGKFAYTLSKATGNSVNPYIRHLRLFDFDRCAGVFSNPMNLNLHDTTLGLGLSFSSNSRFLYTSKFTSISQFDLQAPNLMASRQIVAVYDTFSTGGFTDFGNMYLAANGKIYLTSSGSSIFFNVINSPDSAGLACNVLQHSLQTPCYLGAHHVNHPNYYLGRIQGSACDTLQWSGIEEAEHDFRFRIYPNPISNTTLHIGYLLPQNKSGSFQMYDITGKIVFKYSLPQWSNEQELKLPPLANGIYYCEITSNNQRASKKIAVMQ